MSFHMSVISPVLVWVTACTAACHTSVRKITQLRWGLIRACVTSRLGSWPLHEPMQQMKQTPADESLAHAILSVQVSLPAAHCSLACFAC